MNIHYWFSLLKYFEFSPCNPKFRRDKTVKMQVIRAGYTCIWTMLAVNVHHYYHDFTWWGIITAVAAYKCIVQHLKNEFLHIPLHVHTLAVYVILKLQIIVPYIKCGLSTYEGNCSIIKVQVLACKRYARNIEGVTPWNILNEYLVIYVATLTLRLLGQKLLPLITLNLQPTSGKLVLSMKLWECSAFFF